MKRIYFFLVTLSLVAPVATREARAQDSRRSSETRAEVPALTSFHTVIYRLWHTAWPNKDYEMLAALLPDIESGVANIASADLPGILREKKPAWDENVTRLRATAAAYREAVETKDQQKLLVEGERLHSQFEKLARIIRPVLKEVDAFHAELYMLYHYYMPEHNVDSIRSSVPILAQKMDSLDKATLPRSLATKEAGFVAARSKLSSTVRVLTEMVRTDDEGKMRDAIQSVHAAYVALEDIFR